MTPLDFINMQMQQAVSPIADVLMPQQGGAYTPQAQPAVFQQQVRPQIPTLPWLADAQPPQEMPQAPMGMPSMQGMGMQQPQPMQESPRQHYTGKQRESAQTDQTDDLIRQIMGGESAEQKKNRIMAAALYSAAASDNPNFLTALSEGLSKSYMAFNKNENNMNPLQKLQAMQAISEMKQKQAKQDALKAYFGGVAQPTAQANIQSDIGMPISDSTPAQPVSFDQGQDPQSTGQPMMAPQPVADVSQPQAPQSAPQASGASPADLARARAEALRQKAMEAVQMSVMTGEDGLKVMADQYTKQADAIEKQIENDRKPMEGAMAELVKEDVKGISKARDAALVATPFTQQVEKAEELVKGMNDLTELGPVMGNLRKWTHTTSDDMQKLQSIGSVLTPLARTLLQFPGANFSDADREMLERAVGGDVGLDKKVILFNLDRMKKLAQQVRVDVPEMESYFGNKGSLLGFAGQKLAQQPSAGVDKRAAVSQWLAAQKKRPEDILGGQ